jgi:hypothetical protein
LVDAKVAGGHFDRSFCTVVQIGRSSAERDRRQ